MPLTLEWLHRIQRWQQALWKNFYRPLGSIALSGFTTFDHLTPDQVNQQNFTPMPAGTPWGAKWEYAWFRGSLTLPEEARGQRIVLQAAQGFESLVWINGELLGSYGWARDGVLLAPSGVPGTTYEILMESYAGHGVPTEGSGPVRHGEDPTPEPPPQQRAVNEASFGVWLEDLYQLALDFTTLFELREKLDPLSLRVCEIDDALMDATRILDLELPEGELLASARAARERLAPALACPNGPTMPTLHAFGHAHLDVAWLWPWAETERKIARTAINQLELLKEYPEHRYLQSQAHLYTLLKHWYPEVYERFKVAVRAGNFIPDGAMWVEADTNITGGEALIRQILYGQRFFREEFGAESRILWLPDVFGYSGALPQILAGCGVEGFATQKIAWAYHGGDPFPYNTFWWEGIDGSAIPAHIFTDYNSETKPANLLERWNTRLQKQGIRSMILSFGWGDGGGGPTREHLEYLRRCRNLEGLPRVQMSSPAEFFADLKSQGLPKERYVGELYFQAHRGTYTSQARTKRLNRKCEQALHDAEFWGCAARTLRGFEFGPRTLEDAWTRLMLNQFHDILPGSSIHRVYEEAEREFEAALDEAEGFTEDALDALVALGRGITIFNALSWPRREIMLINQKQIEVRIPACGWISLSGREEPAEETGVTLTQDPEGQYILENDLLRATINARGEVESLWDKEAEREWLTGPGNRLCLYKDVPIVYDAWDIDSMAEEMPLETNEPAAFEVIDNGPLMVSLRVTRQLHKSTVTQAILLRSDSRRLDFETEVDWQESHKLLKACFALNVHANDALSEIQFGHLRRPTHRSRPYDADRFEVSNHKWSALAEENRGAAILNDCKYGISAKGNCLNLTLLKSATAPDGTADKGKQTFIYSLYTWNGSFAACGVVREAYELNNPPVMIPGQAETGSLFQLDAENIVLETLKPAEDGSTDLILRLYEAKRGATHCTLTTTLPVQAAQQTNLREEFVRDLPLQDGKMALDFHPFEIKTIRLKM